MHLVKTKEKPHNIKIEDLEMSKEYADQIESELSDFLEDLGFSKDRIEGLECRSRDGFSAYSHNKGGLGAISYLDRNSLPNGSLGFKNADATIEKYADMDLKNFAEENSISEDYNEWSEEQQNAFSEYQHNGEENSILLSVDMMLNSDTELNIRMCVCVKEAPYHRQYDDLIEFNIEFKSLAGLNQKLNRILKNRDVMKFEQNMRDAW